MKDIKTATEEWVDSFNSYPISIIEKAYMESDIDGISEITPIIQGDEVWSNEYQDICNVITIDRDKQTAVIRTEEEGIMSTVPLDDLFLDLWSYLPMCGTLWSFGDSADDWWIENLENKIKMAEAGFRLYYTEELGIIFGIDGAGYSFYEAHWIPLYEARGLQWHNHKLDLDQLLMKHFGTTNSNGYSALVTLLYDLQEVGVSKDNIHDIIEYLDIERGWKE